MLRILRRTKNENKNVLRFHLSVAEINRGINSNDGSAKISKYCHLLLQTSSRETGFDGIISLDTSDENNRVLWNLINLSLFPLLPDIRPS